MPDQSSAADEHALIQEITAPLGKLPDDPVPIAADVNFPLALRGYDRIAVDAYVKKTSQLVAELQASRSPDSAVRRALERVGQEVSGILQRAHDTSEQITSQSRREAEDRLERAREEATRITADAHNRLKDLDSETDRIWAERQQIVEDTRELARQLLVLADTAAERFPPAEEHAAASTGEGEAAPKPAALAPAGGMEAAPATPAGGLEAAPATPAAGGEAAPETFAPPPAGAAEAAPGEPAPPPAESVEAAPGAPAPPPSEERPRPGLFDHAAIPDHDSAPGVDQEPVGAPGDLEGETAVSVPDQAAAAGGERASKPSLQSDADRASGETDVPDDEATVILPPVRPTESGEQQR